MRRPRVGESSRAVSATRRWRLLAGVRVRQAKFPGHIGISRPAREHWTLRLRSGRRSFVVRLIPQLRQQPISRRRAPSPPPPPVCISLEMLEALKPNATAAAATTAPSRWPAHRLARRRHQAAQVATCCSGGRPGEGAFPLRQARRVIYARRAAVGEHSRGRTLGGRAPAGGRARGLQLQELFYFLVVVVANGWCGCSGANKLQSIANSLCPLLSVSSSSLSLSL